MKTILTILVVILIIGGVWFLQQGGDRMNGGVPIEVSEAQERAIVEQYLRDNIKDIATNEEVLGGTWYVVDINVVPGLNQGEVVYEDGHIQSSAAFTYTFLPETREVEIVSFDVLE